MSESIQPPADLQNNRTIIVKRKDGTKGPPVWTIFSLGGPSFRGFCERACPERSRRGGHSRTSCRGPSFSPHHVTSNLVPAILIGDDDQRRDVQLQSKTVRH